MLQAKWPKMSKRQKRRLIEQDEKMVKELRNRAFGCGGGAGKGAGVDPHPFVCEEDDHCETSPEVCEQYLYVYMQHYAHHLIPM